MAGSTSHGSRVKVRACTLLLLLVLVVVVPTGSRANTTVPNFPAHEDVFESWGNDCASRVTHTRFWFDPGTIAKRQEIRTGAAPLCAPRAEPVQTTRAASSSIAVPTDIGGPPKWCPGLGGGNDFIHTSWTLRNAAQDLAWLRSSFFKEWNCSSAWWSARYVGDLSAWTGHNNTLVNTTTHSAPTWPYIEWDCSRRLFDCHQVLAETRADFSEKGLIGGGSCPWSEQINVYAYRDGSWFVDFWTVGQCQGTTSVAAAQANDYSSANFGGKYAANSNLSEARPYVDGA
jgi:hypothetical protein